MSSKDFKIRFFIVSFSAFAILGAFAAYAVWLDISLLHNLQGQILVGAAPAAWLLFYVMGISILPSGIETGSPDSIEVRKKLFRARLLILSFIFFAAVYAAFGTALHNHLIKKGEPWLLQALLYGPPAVWLLFYLTSAGLAPVQAEEGSPAAKQPSSQEEDTKDGEETPSEEPSIPVAAVEEKGPDEEEIRETAVVQFLGLLQREGRLIDFLQEDIEPYEDAQIGAAVREVHRGCRTVLKDALGLSPVMNAQEGSNVEVDEDFDPAKIRLTGNVHGDPPFHGVLRHCGWQATEIRLPVRTGDVDRKVIAPAEVEV